MRRRKYILFRLAGIGLLPLVLTLWTATLYAGDEDMSPSAYHVFDPVTGYMITVDPLAEEQQDSAAPDDLPPKVETTDVTDEPTAPDPWQYWIATIVVAGGVVVWLLKRRESHNVTNS